MAREGTPSILHSYVYFGKNKCSQSLALCLTLCIKNSLASLVKYKTVLDDSCCKDAHVTDGKVSPRIANICLVFSIMVATRHMELSNT